MKKQVLFWMAFWPLCLLAQTKPSLVLDTKQAGYYNQYFDLDENGFLVVFDKSRIDVSATKSKDANQSAFFYSKDLQTRSVFKVSTNDRTRFFANTRYILQSDRMANTYAFKLFDYSGKLLADKQVKLDECGLNAEMINRILIQENGHVLFEIYDLQQYLHLFEFSLFENKPLVEMDIPLPGNDYLEAFTYHSEWTYMNAYKGYHFMYRSGTNKNFDPTQWAIQLAVYDADFSLYRNLVVDDLLENGITLLGKNFSVDIQPMQQAVYVSTLVKHQGKTEIAVWRYDMQATDVRMKKTWQQYIPIVNNAQYKLVEDDGINVPKSPQLKSNGNREEVYLVKDRLVVNDEALSQTCFFDASGLMTYNAVQAGSYYTLNLDGFCGDNGGLYSRFNTCKMKQTLKDLCENKQAEVIDIFVDDQNNELVIVNYTYKLADKLAQKYQARFEIYRFVR